MNNIYKQLVSRIRGIFLLQEIIDEFSARENLFNFKKKESLLRDLYLWCSGQAKKAT